MINLTTPEKKMKIRRTCETIRAEGHAFQSHDGIEDRELMEAVFDQRGGDKHAEYFIETLQEREKSVSMFAILRASVIDTFLKQLPEMTPYSNEWTFT